MGSLEQGCVEDGCTREVYARQVCSRHYQQRRTAGTLPPSLAVVRKCELCGAQMVGRVSNRAQFCSIVCKETARAATQKAVRLARKAGRRCEQCGGSVPPATSGKARFCSKDCSVTWFNHKKVAEKKAANLARQGPCRRCGAPVPADRKSHSMYCSSQCKHNEMGKRFRERDPGYMRRYMYGVSQDQYEAMLAAQGSRCAICRTDTPSGKGGWHVDHCHNSSRVRGLLCHYCNLGLGNFRDDPERLRAAIAYLEAAATANTVT